MAVPPPTMMVMRASYSINCECTSKAAQQTELRRGLGPHPPFTSRVQLPDTPAMISCYRTLCARKQPIFMLVRRKTSRGVREASWGWLVNAYHTSSSAASTPASTQHLLAVPEAALRVGGPGDGVSNRFPI